MHGARNWATTANFCKQLLLADNHCKPMRTRALKTLCCVIEKTARRLAKSCKGSQCHRSRPWERSMLPSKHCARPTSRPSTAHWAWVRYRDSTSPRKQAMPCALECAPRRARAGRRRGARTARAAPGARPAQRRPRRGRAPRRPCPPASACARAAAPDGAAYARCPAERVCEQAHSARASTASCTLHHCRTLI